MIVCKNLGVLDGVDYEWEVDEEKNPYGMSKSDIKNLRDFVKNNKNF